jgi:hypothetical protein
VSILTLVIIIYIRKLSSLEGKFNAIVPCVHWGISDPKHFLVLTRQLASSGFLLRESVSCANVSSSFRLRLILMFPVVCETFCSHHTMLFDDQTLVQYTIVSLSGLYRWWGGRLIYNNSRKIGLVL